MFCVDVTLAATPFSKALTLCTHSVLQQIMVMPLKWEGYLCLFIFVSIIASLWKAMCSVARELFNTVRFSWFLIESRVRANGLCHGVAMALLDIGMVFATTRIAFCETDPAASVNPQWTPFQGLCALVLTAMLCVLVAQDAANSLVCRIVEYRL